jgi:hypothetical protein
MTDWKPSDEFLAEHAEFEAQYPTHFVLGPDGKTPVHEPDFVKWAEWHKISKQSGSFIVGKTQVGGSEVSTVFVGLNLGVSILPGARPVLFETLVFHPDGHTSHSERYHTWDDAEAGHRALVADLMTRTDFTKD